MVEHGRRSRHGRGQAVESGEKEYGDAFFVPVKPNPIERPLSVETHAEHRRHSHGGAHGNGTAQPTDVPAQRTSTPEA